MPQWLGNHVSELVSSDHRPSASPDLNPLDYKLWSVLEGMVYKRCYHNLVEVVDNFLMDIIHIVIDVWPNRLWRYIRANGDYFE